MIGLASTLSEVRTFSSFLLKLHLIVAGHFLDHGLLSFELELL